MDTGFSFHTAPMDALVTTQNDKEPAFLAVASELARRIAEFDWGKT